MVNLNELNQHTQNGLFVITTPNGMTGEALCSSKLIKLIADGESRGNLFIIDLAYSAFDKQPMALYQAKLDNLILIQSYSKSHGVAGLRIATLHLPSTLCQHYKKLGLENALNTLQLEFFDFVTQNSQAFANNIEWIKAEREKLKTTLQTACPNWKIYNTKANFIALDIRYPEKGQKIEQAFLQKNMIIKRICDSQDSYSIIRIAIGNQKDNLSTLSLLEQCHAN